MDENKVKDMIIFLSNSSDDINEQIDTEEMEKTMDQLYYTLYYLRKEINEIIAKLPIDWLTKLVKTLQALSDCQTT
ncbi:MAG: hypothetical protein FK734_02775, partial [Asgard group archaeon]|nr:hypothetical protein [Asgard group archaeon]